jgi:hypothetical protein
MKPNQKRPPIRVSLEIRYMPKPSAMKNIEYDGTGIKRKIWYYMLLIPVFSAKGLENILKFLSDRKAHPNLQVGVLSIVLTTVFLSTVIDTYFFEPYLAERPVEINAIQVMGHLYPKSSVLAPVYHQRLELYGDLKDAEIYYPDDVGKSHLKKLSTETYTSLDEASIRGLKILDIDHILYSKRAMRRIHGGESITNLKGISRIYDAFDVQIYTIDEDFTPSISNNQIFIKTNSSS